MDNAAMVDLERRVNDRIARASRNPNYRPSIVRGYTSAEIDGGHADPMLNPLRNIAESIASEMLEGREWIVIEEISGRCYIAVTA